MLEKQPEDRLLSHLLKARTLAVKEQKAALPLKGEIRVACGNRFGRGIAGKLFLVQLARH